MLTLRIGEQALPHKSYSRDILGQPISICINEHFIRKHLQMLAHERSRLRVFTSVSILPLVNYRFSPVFPLCIVTKQPNLRLLSHVLSCVVFVALLQLTYLSISYYQMSNTYACNPYPPFYNYVKKLKMNYKYEFNELPEMCHDSPRLPR